jgi:glucoamylase
VRSRAIDGEDRFPGVLRALVIALACLLLPALAHARERAPGAPGEKADWAPADKQGFGTSATRASRVWFTLRGGELTEVFYPDLSRPAVRSLRFLIDGKPVRAGAITQDLLEYTQTTATSKWRLARTYITDPERATVVIKVRFESRDGKAHRVELLLDPALSGNGNDDVGWTRGRALLAHDLRSASALVARPAFTRTSSGYVGRHGKLLERGYDALRLGNIVQAARTRLTGRGNRRDLTLALGFGERASLALEAAERSLADGFDALQGEYRRGWQEYRNQLKPIPAAALPVTAQYESALLLLKAHEDKANRGAFIASPTAPWGARARYQAVRPRDLYHVATALHAAGDEDAANRALDFLFDIQLEDGSFPRSTRVDGRAAAPETQLDQVGLAIVLAHQLDRARPADWRRVRAAAEYIVKHGPRSEQDRWEGPEGYSPAALAAQIAGLVCAADIARRNGDSARARRYTDKADGWARNVERWTATANGPYSNRPYYLRLTLDRKPNAAAKYEVGGSDVDQRRVVDAGFLELVRLGVKRATDPVIVNSVAVIDQRLKAGEHWRRFSFDDYGERRNGRPYQESARTLGRAWPLLTGERAEYELAAGRGANALLATVAGVAGNAILPEQVWDGHAPSSRRRGTPTTSAAPHAWTLAQFVRLAWSAEAGRPIERPKIVADRYG